MEPYRPNCYKIPELNGLRVLLVFIVSWYHFWQQSWLTPSIGSYSLDYLLRAGYMPVDGTILLSGFLPTDWKISRSRVSCLNPKTAKSFANCFTANILTNPMLRFASMSISFRSIT